MNLTKVGLVVSTIVALLGTSTAAKADLPTSFPGIVVSNYQPAAVSPGCVFLAVASEVTNVGHYLMIVTNDGSIVWYQEANNAEIYDFKVLPNGRLHYAPSLEPHGYAEGGDVVHKIMDKNYNALETITGGNGYVADGHDFQLLPNGNVLQFGYYLSEVDMSKVVAGGNPAALVSGGVIQELDGQRNVVFQWRTWDHYGFETNLTSTNAVISAFHLTTLFQDADGHIIWGTPEGFHKISRQTGDILWHLGGPKNQFTFAGGGAPGDFAGHALNLLPNGNYLVYENGSSEPTGAPSKAHEYTLDQVTKVATRVWTYTSSPAINGWHGGNAQRMDNGNTLIGWGGANGAPSPTCTEVNPAGERVFEIYFTNFLVESYRAFRFPWPPEQEIGFTWHGLFTGNTYDFTNTGVTINVQAGGGGYNSFTVTREPYAPVDPIFPGTALRTLPLRVKMSEAYLPEGTLTALISFDPTSFGFNQPADLKVYYRAEAGIGTFLEQLSAYNPGTGQLECQIDLSSTGGDMGEFIFCYADLPDVAYAPMLHKPENYRGIQPHDVIAPPLAATGAVYTVNQQLPISLSWSPKGMARWYELQIATDQDFATPVVDVGYQTEAYYHWSDALPNMTYYYRVRTQNDAGASDWSVGSFQTVPPLIQVMTPNGGEAWQRGLGYFVQWSDNVAGSVVIDLYKGGSFLRSLATNSSAGAYQWQVDQDLVPGTDYSIRVSSAANPSLNDSSDMPFSIADVVPVTITTAPAGLTVTVDGSNYTAPALFNWMSGSPHTVNTPSPQTSADAHTRYPFTSWSDAGTQSHTITASLSTTTYTATFSTQYLLDVTITASDGGTVTPSPAGPWYNSGQVVSLTANTNTGYRFYGWSGVDSQSGNTAQLSMGSYRTIIATFLPVDYPYITITSNGGAAPGNLIGNIGGRTTDKTKLYYVILDNSGANPVFASTNNTLYRFVTPQGFDAVSGGGVFSFKDETITVVDTNKTLGYTLDTHDVKLWPNGHALVFGSEVRTFDMSTVVTNGKTAASVTGDIIQELDANKRLVFEWHTFDHIAITNTFADMAQASFDYAHVNAMTIDPTDNNLLASLRTTSEIVKINRRTGQVMWRLGGKSNQFTFNGEHAENAPYYTVGQHDVHRLANGNLLYFDNGNISGGGVTPSDRTYTRVVEYALDEVAKTATLVWEYRHTPDISAGCTGSIKRFPNGNTLIDWGCAVPTSGTIITEVNAAGQVVFEMQHRTNSGISSVQLGGGLTKQLWNSPDLIRSATYQGIQSGQTYTAAAAGVALTINSLSGAVDNALVVQRHLDAVRFPKFAGKAPQVVMEHIVLSGSNIVALEAELNLSLPDTTYVFDTPMIHDPAQVVVYHRPTPGQGQFSSLTTTYDPGTQKLRVTTTQMGEFIFAYPDVAETAYAPVINSPADQSEVNQAAPVTLTWTPQGLVGSFDLQVATDAGFANLVLNTNGLSSGSYVLQNPLPNTQHFWRVRCVNQGGNSDWASASFTAVPPVLELTVPAGGEVWQRFQAVTIRWNDNIPENVALDIYKDGVSNRTIAASIASSGSYAWTVGQFQAFPPGTNYTMKIRSTTNPAIYNFSKPFSMITNLTSVTIATVPTNLVVTIDGTNYTSPAVFTWLPSTSHTVDTASPQLAGDGHSRYLFASWSDGGAQSHAVTVPFSTTNYTANSSTQFLLGITCSPSDGGTTTSAPTGPWYDAGQLVSIAANTNAGYRFSAWSGIDSQSGNTAQVTMSSYRNVVATFLPQIVIYGQSRLPDGRIQFSLTAPGAAQATVLGSTNLSKTNLSDWQELKTVPVNNGSAVFTDDTATNYPARFYRVRVP